MIKLVQTLITQSNSTLQRKGLRFTPFSVSTIYPVCGTSEQTCDFHLVRQMNCFLPVKTKCSTWPFIITLDNFFSSGYILTFHNARSSEVESTIHTDNRSCINAGSGNLYLYTFSNIIHFLSSKGAKMNAGRSIYHHLGETTAILGIMFIYIHLIEKKTVCK